jgi:hypothetical protein
MSKVSVMTDSRKVRIGYLAAGVVTAVLWQAHDGSPLEHALRLLALMAIVMGGSWLAHRVAERRGRTLPQHPVGRFLLAKVAVVAVALVAAVALENVLADPNLWVALGMGATVALLGPSLHPWLMNAEPAPTAADDEALERLVTTS